MAQSREKNIEQQVQFWALIGPFISLLTLLVSVMRASPMQVPFAITMIVALPLCWKWKLRGFAISVGLIAGAFAYHFLDMSPALQLWSGGVVTAATLSLLATALSYDEVSSLIDSMHVESKSRLDSMLNLDEKLKQASERHHQQSDELKARIRELEYEEENLKYRVEASEKGAQVVREELATTHTKMEDLLQELYSTRNNHSRAQKQIQELQEQLESRPVAENTEHVKELETVSSELAQLKEQLHKGHDQIKVLESQLEYVNEEKCAVEHEYSNLKSDFDTLKNEIDVSNEMIELLEEERTRMHAALSELEAKAGTDVDEIKKSYMDEIERRELRISEMERRIESLTASIDEKEQEIQIERKKHLDSASSSEEKELVLHKMIEEAKVEKDQLHQENTKLQAEAATLKEQIDTLKIECETLKKADAPAKKEKDSGALRKAEGRYKQLKQQFDEKSKILDDTRRALFHMQERLFNMQREMDESKRSEKSEEEQLLEQHIKKMAEERKVLEVEHQKEIDDLHEIIESLSKGKEPASVSRG